MEGVCKLTGQHTKFIRSHIVPRSFLNLDYKRGEDPLRVYALNSKQQPKRSQTGLYDASIVGKPGEKILARLDAAASDFLNVPIKRADYVRDEHGFILRDADREKAAYLVAGDSYRDLKLFVLSIFWRASVSSLQELVGFRLRPGIEERIRSMLLANDPGIPEEMSVSILRYLDKYGVPLVTPNRIKIAGVPHVQTTFGQFRFFMKTANLASPSPVDEIQMRPGRRNVILTGNFLDGRFGQSIREKFRDLYHQDA
jgi:hypothetical protein